MVAGILGLVILIAKLFPETPAGAWLHRHLVDHPLEMISKVELKHIIFLLVGVFFIQSFAMIAPMDFAIVAAWDFTIYIEAVIATSTLSIVTRSRVAWSAFKTKIAHLPLIRALPRARSRTTRTVEKRPHQNATNDNEHRRAIASAA